MKRIALAVTVLVGLLVGGSPAQAAIRDGAKCPKAGQSRTVKLKNVSTKYICVKEGKKLVWRGGCVPPG